MDGLPIGRAAVGRSGKALFMNCWTSNIVHPHGSRNARNPIREMEMERKLTTIAAMDVVGYSRLMEADEEGTLERLQTLRSEIIVPAITGNSGRVFKEMGDGTLAEFSSVVGAVQSMLAIQDKLATMNDVGGANNRIDLRIGIHLGDVIIEGDDIYGDGVNIAARLESIAPPGGIVLSKQVQDHIGSKIAVNLVPMGAQTVKNISRPIEVYRIESQGEAISPGIIRFGRFELDSARFELRESGEPVSVEPQVFDLLLFLASNCDRTVTRDEIFSKIWGDRIVSDAALSSQIKAARRAVGDSGNAQHTVRTVHGRGFRFVAAVELAEASGPADEGGEEILELPPQVRSRPTIAVLPFENLNRDSDEDYFVDGITEDIITALSKYRWFAVIARNPAFAFRNSTEGIQTIGRQLGADYIVTGSVRKAGSRVRIAVQLADADARHSIWSERFDREVVDIFDLQDEITEIVVSRLEAELGLSEQKKAKRQAKKDLGAWELYQLGTAEFYKFTRQSNVKSQELLRRAIELDPELAAAHSRLAYAIILSMVYFDVLPDDNILDEALAAARRAIELDDQDANGYFTIGRVYLARREYDKAIDALEHALELNPCLALIYCGLGDSLAYEGRLDEAIEQFEIAIRLSPHDPFRWAFYSYRSLAHLFRHEYDEAAAWARKAVQIPNAQYWAKAHLVAALGYLDDEVKQKRAVNDLKQVKPDFSTDFAEEHLFYLKRPEQKKIYLEGLRKAGIE